LCIWLIFQREYLSGMRFDAGCRASSFITAHTYLKKLKGTIMARGDKSKYTDKQKRQAEHIEEGYEHRGHPDKESERRAWATVNKMTHGGRKPGGSGQGTTTNKGPAKKGGRLGGKAAASRSPAERSASAKKAARTRARHQSRSKSSAR
jgi:hypothetical protein